MASAADPETELKCPICVQDYQEPRKLPGCIHCFCENCILTFVFNLKKENKLGQEFECPVCRLPSPAPEEENVTLDWVRTMEPNVDLIRGTKRKVVGDDSEWCSQCNSNSKSENSNIYCLNCQDYFCKPCSDTLHGFHLARNHILVDIDNHRTDRLCSEALKLLRNALLCSVHGDKPVEFCTKYNKKVLCSSCIAESVDARDLGSVQTFKDIITTSSKTESTTLLETTTNLQNYISEVTEVIKKNGHETKADLERITLELNEMKNKVVHLFEVLENNIQTDGNAIKKEIAIENEDKLNNLRHRTRRLKAVRYLLENFMAKISPEQGCLCVNKIERVIKELEADAMKTFSLAESKKITFKSTEMLDTMKAIGPNETSLLASVGTITSEIALPIYKQRSRMQNKRYEKSGVYKIFPEDKPRTILPTYNGILFLPNNQYLLTDSCYGFYCLADETKASVGSYNKYFDRKPKCSDYFSNLRYATYMASSTLALGIPSHRKIIFVTVDKTFTVKGKIDCARTPKAIFGLNNGDLAVSWGDPVAFGVITGQLGSYKETIYFTSDKSGRQLKSFDYMSIDEDHQHVIQPCTVDKAVYCFDFDGQPIFKYVSSELKEPKGVGIDYDGDIYVCDMAGGIHVVSREGQAVCIIREGCPEEPLAIGFSIDKKNFAVTQYGGHWKSVLFFSIVSE